jgi:CheY-like chemotaxis protein
VRSSETLPDEWILVIEDDAGVRESLVGILEDEGCSVVTARNGQEAIECLATHPPPRLILIDLMMPIMDGFKFRAAQLKDPAIATIPTVVLSAARDGKEQARALGVQGYLQKPIALDDLLRLVHHGVGS